MKIKRKRSSLRFSPFFCPDFLPNVKGDGEGHDSILRTILKYLCITGTPKGWAMAQCPPPKYAPGCNCWSSDGSLLLSVVKMTTSSAFSSSVLVLCCIETPSRIRKCRTMPNQIYIYRILYIFIYIYINQIYIYLYIPVLAVLSRNV